MSDELKQNEAPLEEAEATDVSATEAEELKAAIASGDFDINDFLSQYKEALAAREEAETRALRVQADFDNFRRRSRKDTEESGKRAAGELICCILPILDNFERALNLMEDSSDKEGVGLIYRQLYAVLENAGLHEIEALGAEFDPNLHQAVTQEPADNESKGKVLMVLQKGYMFEDKLLRPAMVQVGI
jgi:molecular chaperone GrpE